MGEELTRSLAELAARGTPRGAGRVLEGARRDAGRETFPGPALAWRRGLVVAVGSATAALLVLGAVILLVRPFSGEEPSPVVTEPPEVATTASGVHQPEELVPTGVHLLTQPSHYPYVVRGSSGVIWAGGDDQVARFDPVNGEARVWTQSDDAAFGLGVRGLAPAGGGGVWVILGDGSLRRFDGELFSEIVAAPPLAQDWLTEDWARVAGVVETNDGGLLAATLDGGVFAWDGSSWSRFDDARPVIGASALAIGAGGSVWVGDAEMALVEEREDWGVQTEWRPLGRGVSRFDGEVWKTFTGDDAAALAGLVLTIEPLPDGTVWVGTEAGSLARFDGGSWSDIDLSQIGLSGETYAAVGPDGTIWAATDAGADGGEGVASFDGSTWTVHGPQDGLPVAGAGSRPVATEDGVFVGTGAGLFRLLGDRWTQVLPPPGPTGLPMAPEPPTALHGVWGLEASDDFLWAWGDDEIWRYADGAWSPYSALPSTGDGGPSVTYARDTLWVFNDSTVLFLEGEEWVGVAAAPPEVRGRAADPDSGPWWDSTGEHLLRWDGEEMTNVGAPKNWLGSDWGYVGDIVVTADGSVWASGLFAYTPWNGGLARYDDTTSSWETVRPLGGAEDVPAWSWATTPEGDLWVMLSRWSRDWENPATGLPGWALAHRDGVSGEWTVYNEGLPEGFPGVMAADDDGVWLTAGDRVGDFEPRPGILRFDGRTWTQYLADTDATDTIDSFAVAPDGTIWYTINDVLHQLEVP